MGIVIYSFLRAGLIVTIVLSASLAIFSQTWEFAKEKNGVKLYTKKDPGKSLKAYKGDAIINAPAEKIFAMLEDVNHTEWWDKNLSEIRVMKYEKDKFASYYIVYDLSWPVTDRDLYVEAFCSIDPVTGIRKITAKSVDGVVPVSKDIVRISEYHQVWTVKPVTKEKSYVELEGYADPSGSVPDWLTNMLIVDSPFKVISNVKEKMEKR
jgi:hypothetical protein